MKSILRSVLSILGLSALVIFSGFANSVVAQPSSTLKEVQERGFVKCGVTGRMPGFSIRSENGEWTGFNIDFCRALASAVLKNADAIQASDYWIDALVGGDIDVLHAGSTWTFGRDTTQKVEFSGIYFYDGQGFITHANLGAKNLGEAMQKQGLKVCAISKTSTALSNLEDFIAQKNVAWEIVQIHTMDGMWRAFFGGRCDMAIHDRTALAGIHAQRLNSAADFVVFPEVISKEPLSPAVRQDDFQWRDLVAWVTFVTVAAEEFGITQQNVDFMKANSTAPEVRRLLGVDKGLGKGFGLDDEWAYRVIKQVGNYADIFERNLGINSIFKMSRGLNNTWQNGGLHYAPPLR
ncbi:MAG: amino acid ABC transporter substrate-binding protein [Rhodospirillaceae bacterium]|nr:MAG: amino acid ABC transporter substrate-binding protein [Rhodospirillaceae bacterium]